MVEPHVQRMQEEADELRERMSKLSIFIDGANAFQRLDPEDQLLLRLQLSSMHTYESVLTARLKRAEG